MSDFTRRLIACAAVFAFGLVPLSKASADAFPGKPIRIIVPFSAGGVADIVARLLAERMSERLGQRAYVENKPGAGGSIGFEMVARSPADGYTLVMASPGFAINPSLQRGLSWDPVADFAPVAMVASIPNVIVVSSKAPYRSVPDLLADARKRPSSVTFASAGIGSSPHLAGELLNVAGQVQMLHVPYKGQADAVRDVMEGSVSFMALTTALAKPHIDAGRMRPLAVTTLRRAKALPAVPTVAEEGVNGYEVDAWIALLAPKDTPREALTKLNEAVREVLGNPEVAAKLAQLGCEIASGTPEQLGAYVRAEKDKWAKTIAAAGIKPE